MSTWGFFIPWYNTDAQSCCKRSSYDCKCHSLTADDLQKNNSLTTRLLFQLHILTLWQLTTHHVSPVQALQLPSLLPGLFSMRHALQSSYTKHKLHVWRQDKHQSWNYWALSTKMEFPQPHHKSCSFTSNTHITGRPSWTVIVCGSPVPDSLSSYHQIRTSTWNAID